MINDYLKTSLVFYDDITRQHKYNGCCQDTTKWDIPKTARNRLIPFQIKIGTYDWFGDINTVRLYDEQDNLVANLITDYGIYPHIKVVSNCNWQDEWVWVIYDNTRPLSGNLPTGNHYIEIRDDRGNAWYSEIFMICDTTAIEFNKVIEDEWEAWTFTTFISDGLNITEAGAGIGGPFTADTFGWCEWSEVGDIYDYQIKCTLLAAWLNLPRFRLETDDGGVASNIVVINDENTHIGSFTVTAAGFLHLGMTVLGRCSFSADITITKRDTTRNYEGMVGVEWYNECDFDDIIYQELDKWAILLCPYENRLNFETNVELLRTDTIKNVDEALGTDFVKSVVQKTYYGFKVLVPEWLYLVLQSLQAYANNSRGVVNIYLNNGDVGVVEELNVLEEKIEGNCYYHLTIEFREEAKVWTNCCNNYALIDESSCADDVSYG